MRITKETIQEYKNQIKQGLNTLPLQVEIKEQATPNTINLIIIIKRWKRTYTHIVTMTFEDRGENTTINEMVERTDKLLADNKWEIEQRFRIWVTAQTIMYLDTRRCINVRKDFIIDKEIQEAITRIDNISDAYLNQHNTTTNSTLPTQHNVPYQRNA